MIIAPRLVLSCCPVQLLTQRWRGKQARKIPKGLLTNLKGQDTATPDRVTHDALCKHGRGNGDAACDKIQVTLALAGDAAPLHRVLLHEADGLQLLQDVADQTTRRSAKVLWHRTLHTHVMPSAQRF